MTSQANTEVRDVITSVDLDWQIDRLTVHFLPPHIAEKIAAAILTWHTQEIERIIGKDELETPSRKPNHYLTRSQRTVRTRNILRAEQRKRAGI